jgi:hypothetical protein
MIKINSKDGKKKIFENYHQACDYLNRIEKNKAIETGEINWMFIRRRHETISMFYYASPLWKKCLTQKENEAVEKQLGLIEIKKGDNENFIQFLYKSPFDIEPLKRNWKCKIIAASMPVLSWPQEFFPANLCTSHCWQ